MTQQTPSSSPKQRRRILPIIPVIPRSLEKKPKQVIKASPSEGADVVPLAAEIKEGILQEKTPPLAIVQLKDQDTPNDIQTIQKLGEVSPRNDALGKPAFSSASPILTYLNELIDVHNFPPTPQSPELEDHVLNPESPYQPDSLHPPPPNPLPDGHKTELQSEVGEDSPLESRGLVGVDGAIKSQERQPKPTPHTLRATASVFHAHSAPSDNVRASPTASTQKDADSASSEFIPTKSESVSEVTTSPIEPAYHGYGHAHNISFYPPPQSIDDASPTHSIYKGYTYNHPQHADAYPQYSQPYQPQIEAFISTGRQYAQDSPYYAGMPLFSTLGSQAPLTPSATPLDNLPGPWSLPNGVSNGILGQSTHADDRQRHRSHSHSTLRSDSILSGSATTASGQVQPFRNDANGMHSRANVTDGISLQTPFHEVPLVDHLLRLFNNPKYADCELLLSQNEHRFPLAKWYLSSILLIQSRKLQDLLTSSFTNPAQTERKILKLHLTDRFITPTAMDAVLRTLYGTAAISYVPATAVGSNQASAECSMSSMKECLAYAASGCLLHLKDVVLQGLKIASEILCWGNVEAALSFALESGLEREYNASSAVIPAYSDVLPRDSDPSPSSHTILTPSSSSDQAAQTESPTSASISVTDNQKRAPPQHAFDLLMHCLDYIVHHFPTPWELDLSARPLADVDRLPVTVESRSPLSKSRLSRIQFGDHPSEMASKSSDRNVLLSSIILSIPFIHLRYLLSSAGEPLGRNMGAIIKERERRRQIVVQSRSVSWNARMAAKDYEWAEAGYEESTDTCDNGMIKISRRYTGIARNPTDENTTD